ncbi:hypothetical protein CHLRE_08g378417v5 [Chlamydomonas reinhardtii]|uniref:Uncharacterized protein n=1 Tax=Chlamydomonas reinhardtii TaxID=3055 RepID=A0A2K3DHV7_CHLRE|nr:uncharacterized protein CHLRE_08g378417v5 [Chlamydomonas reinhardtii]PNW80112.1 hypothetical protein CHLRE_08g378417v5 [Chlamydomonas reinhardtii]
MARHTASAKALAVVTALLALSAATAAHARKTMATVGPRRQLPTADVCSTQQPSDYCNAFFAQCATFTCSGNVVTLTLSNGGAICKDAGGYSWAACLKAGGAACGTQTNAQCSPGAATFKSPGGTYCDSGASVASWTLDAGVTQCPLTNGGNGCYAGNSGCTVW